MYNIKLPMEDVAILMDQIGAVPGRITQMITDLVANYFSLSFISKILLFRNIVNF